MLLAIIKLNATDKRTAGVFLPGTETHDQHFETKDYNPKSIDPDTSDIPNIDSLSAMQSPV